MNILITGANGCLGTEVVSQLKNSGHELFLVDLCLNRFLEDEGLHLMEEDLSDPEALNTIEDKIDCIIHLAARVHEKAVTDDEKQEFYRINYEATEKLYSFGIRKTIRHFIFISTVSVYGDHSSRMVNEKSICSPVSDYARSKLQAEQLGLDLYKSRNLPITIFRVATMYGPYDRGNYGKLIRTAQKGLVPIVGDGSNHKAIVYVKDVAQIIIQSLLREHMTGEIYNISEDNYRYSCILDIIRDVFNRRSFTIKCPHSVLNIYRFLGIRSGIMEKLVTLSRDFSVDNTKLVSTLNYKYRYNLREGLQDAHDFYTQGDRLS